jgi:nicotinamide-nucleotide amidase
MVTGTDILLPTLAELMVAQGLMLATAESCTGGLIAGACTELSGSSAWFERGFVCYSNDAKIELLGVDPAHIVAYGAVSQVVARAMAAGAVARSHARVSVAVTGVAGPTGGSPEKPVGTVWFGWSVAGMLHSEHRVFDGDRAAIRAATVQHAIENLVRLLQRRG